MTGRQRSERWVSPRPGCSTSPLRPVAFNFGGKGSQHGCWSYQWHKAPSVNAESPLPFQSSSAPAWTNPPSSVLYKRETISRASSRWPASHMGLVLSPRPRPCNLRCGRDTCFLCRKDKRVKCDI